MNPGLVRVVKEKTPGIKTAPLVHTQRHRREGRVGEGLDLM